MAFSANADVASEVEVIEAAQTSAFSSIYAGLGIGGSFLKTDLEMFGINVLSKKANRFIGSFVLGAGKVFSNNFYVGGEFLMDFTKNKKFEYDNGDAQMKGFIPQVDLKFGYVFKNDVLAYAKLGGAWSKVSAYAKSTDKTYSKSKLSFVVGLGVEKAFCKKFSAAVEGDYNFGFKDGDIIKVTCNKGWTVRALVKYNVKY